MTDQPPDDILCERRGALGLLTLNRPKALNALSLPLIAAMRAQLAAWAADPAITRVAVRGAGGRAFCAGGDIRRIYAAAKAGRADEVDATWRGEYRLVAEVARYPKPYVALIDGIVMGGGVGISLHAPYRVALPGYSFAMPEVGIGFFPDVGTSAALPRLPDRAGAYLALTGSRIGAGDALAVGLATHAASAIEPILDALAEGGPVDAALRLLAAPAPETGPLVQQRGAIARCFAPGSPQAVLARLDAEGTAFAAETASLIRTRSPTSLCIAAAQLRHGAALDVAGAIRTEFRLVRLAMAGHDFYEGVRAAVIDKDGRPVWRPADLDAVDIAAIEAAFAPAANELELEA